MSSLLRKYGITDRLLEEFSMVIQRENKDPQSFTHEDEIEIPVSVEFCKSFKKPKKIWNSCIKMNIHNLQSVKIKPGYYTFICKSMIGNIFHIDIEKTPGLSHKRALEKALDGLAEQILELKAIKVAKKQAEQAKLKERLQGVDLKLPDGLELTDDLVDQIEGVLDEIKTSNVKLEDDNVVEGEFVPVE